MADTGNEKPTEQRSRDIAQPSAADESHDRPTSLPNAAEEPSPIEQQLSGAVRRAVTDVLKTNQQQPDLPAIDMNFVVGEEQTTAVDGKAVVVLRPETLASPAPSQNVALVAKDTAAPSRSKSMIIGGGAVTVLALIAVAVFIGPNMQPGDGTTSVANAASVPLPTTTANQQGNSGSRSSATPSAAGPVTARLEQEVADLKAAAEGERLLLQAKLEANRAALAEAKKQAALQQRNAAAGTSSTKAERLLLEAQLAAKRAALAEAESRARLTQLEAAEEKAATQAERLLLETKRAAVEEAERRIALQREVAAEQRATAEAERLLLDAKQAAVEEAAKRLTRQRQEASQRKAAAQAAEERLSELRAATPLPTQNPSILGSNSSGSVAAAETALASEIEKKHLDALKAAEEEVARYRAAEMAAIEKLRQAAKEARLTQSAVRSDPAQSQNQTAGKGSEPNSAEKKIVLATALKFKPGTATAPSTANPPTANTDLPENWAEEEKVRLKLEQLLIAAAKEASTRRAPRLQSEPMLARRVVTLQLKNSNLKVSGELKSHNAKFFVIVLPTREEISLPVEYFNCTGDNCPQRLGDG